MHPFAQLIDPPLWFLLQISAAIYYTIVTACAIVSVLRGFATSDFCSSSGLGNSTGVYITKKALDYSVFHLLTRV